MKDFRLSLLSPHSGINLRENKANGRVVNIQVMVRVITGSQVEKGEEQLQATKPWERRRGRRQEGLPTGAQSQEQKVVRAPREQRWLGHQQSPLHLPGCRVIANLHPLLLLKIWHFL